MELNPRLVRAPRTIYLTTTLSLCALLAACSPVQILDWLVPPIAVERTISLDLAVWSSGSEGDQVLQTLIDEYGATAGAGGGQSGSGQSGSGQAIVDLQIVPQYGRALVPLLEDESGPDVVLVDTFSLPELVAANLLAPLNVGGLQTAAGAGTGEEESPSIAPALLDDLYPELKQAFTVNQRLYCIPREFTTLALLYNRRLFQEAELAFPAQGWRWSDLQTSAQTLTETTNPFFSTFGMALDADMSRWMAFMAQAGGSVTGPDPASPGQLTMTIDSAESLQSLEFYLGLAVDGNAVEPLDLSSSWAGEAFGIGRIGMIVEGSWVLPYLANEFPDLDYGVVPLPLGPRSPQGGQPSQGSQGSQGQATVSFGNCYAISANSPNKQNAARLIEYLTSSESMSRWQPVSGLLPARISLEASVTAIEPMSQPFYEGLAYAIPWQLPPGFDALVDAVNGSMQQVLDAEVDPAEVVRVGRVIGTDILQNQR